MIAILLACSIACVAVPPGEGKPGEPAPPIEIEELLQAPLGARTTADALRGKVIVLELWATYCAPCVAALPHLNELAEKFSAWPVQFIAVTHEGRERVEAFLSKREMRGWIGLDMDHSVFTAYGVTSVPTTIVIDAGGKVALVAHPEDVKAETLEDVLAGRPVAKPAGELPRISIEPGVDPWTGDASPPLLRILIRETKFPGGRVLSPPAVSPDTHAMTWLDASFGDLMDWIHGGTPARRRVEVGDIESKRFDAVVSVPKGGTAPYARLRAVAKTAVEAALGIASREEVIETDVYAIRIAEKGKLKPAVSHGGYRSAAPGHVVIVNGTIETLASVLERQLDWPVVDESGSADGFDFDLSWKAGDLDSLVAALRRDLGLALVRASKAVSILRVSRVEEGG